MIAPEILLTMTPLDALRAQIGENVKSPLKADYLFIGPPVVVSGLKTKVKVTIDKTKAPVELWDRAGSFDFEYSRIDLNQFTAGLNKTVKQLAPTMTEVLIRQVFAPYGIPIVESDIREDYVAAFGNVAAVANPLSWRWVGSTTLTFQTMAIPINDNVTRNTFTFTFSKEHKSADIKARLISSLNIANATNLPVGLTLAMATVGAPVVNGPDNEGDNTKLPLTFNGAPYTGTLMVYYSRRAFNETFNHPIMLSGPRPANRRELAAKLGAKLGCDIQQSDLKSEAFPTTATKFQMVVKFDDNSLAYTGSVLVDYTVTT